MNGSDGSGCAMAILTACVVAAVLMVAVAATGLPNISAAGLAWDTTASAEAAATERLRIETEAATERMRIAERADTERTALLVAGLVAALLVAGSLAVAVAREIARRPVIVVQADARRLHSAHRDAYRLYADEDPHAADAEPRRLAGR